ncbi:hypothetical protein ACQPZX_20060 [Actinoplanes sp. CA-142083]|uniref:hypothetical protein n=1 Tax=Actinoplanes sp. CA-142083 TaxID=3239903 RepID=UPI003D8B02B7
MFQPQGEGEGDDPLLGAVVQVAFQPAALGIGRRDDARPLSPQIRQLGLPAARPSTTSRASPPVIAYSGVRRTVAAVIAPATRPAARKPS